MYCTYRISWNASRHCAKHERLSQCEQSQKYEIRWKTSAHTFTTCHRDQRHKQNNYSDPHQFWMRAQKAIGSGMVHAKCNKQDADTQLSLKSRNIIVSSSLFISTIDSRLMTHH